MQEGLKGQGGGGGSGTKMDGRTQVVPTKKGRKRKEGKAGIRGRNPWTLASCPPTCHHSPRVPKLAMGGAIFCRWGQPASNTPSPSACSPSLLAHSRNRPAQPPPLHPQHSCHRAPPSDHSAFRQHLVPAKNLGKGLWQPEHAGWALRGFSCRMEVGAVTSLPTA